jgi:type VI secretion system protein ImpF
MQKIKDHVTPSVLDRLIDYEPEKSHENLALRAASLSQLKQSVKRDLEWLLNTRYVEDEVSPSLKEVNNSLAIYGLPDFSHLSFKNSANLLRLRNVVKNAITIFEPRLEDVEVTIESMRDGERQVRFRVDARLRVEPKPEPITFDTMLQLGNGQYIVQGE